MPVDDVTSASLRRQVGAWGPASPTPGGGAPTWTTALWAERLAAFGDPLPPPGTRLGAGAIDPYLLAAAAGDSGGGVHRDCELEGDGLELRLWRLLRVTLRDVAGGSGGSGIAGISGLVSLVDAAADGPLIEPGGHAAIEVWTESELAALHAFGAILVECGWPEVASTAPWGERLGRARRWHLRHTQPDNASTRPWAIAVFALDPDDESQLFAQGLLHHALVAAAPGPRGPVLEPLSRVILAHAARLMALVARRASHAE